MGIKRSYESLAKVGQKYYNDTNFCTVIAVATVCQMSFGKARAKMEKAGRKHRKGTFPSVYHGVIKARGYEMESIGGYLGDHVRTMGKKLGKGTYLVQVRGHVLAIVDGKINDWSEDRALRVRTVYKITKKG